MRLAGVAKVECTVAAVPVMAVAKIPTDVSIKVCNKYFVTKVLPLPGPPVRQCRPLAFDRILSTKVCCSVFKTTEDISGRTQGCLSADCGWIIKGDGTDGDAVEDPRTVSVKGFFWRRAVSRRFFCSSCRRWRSAYFCSSCSTSILSLIMPVFDYACLRLT